ncbi:MAG: lysophospholipid acyltransferase family protein [Gammaproteobacteria bacterium]
MFRNNDVPVPIINSDDSPSGSYNTLLLLTALAFAMYLLARFAESQNRLKYESRVARIMSGLFRFIANTMHTKSGDMEITNTERQILAIGPHRTGFVDADVVASKMIGSPPRFLATDGFNFIPGIRKIMDIAQVISVPANPVKSGDGKTPDIVELASKALSENACVALFPQGNFSNVGQEPPRVYEGAAKMALKNNVPIRVIRLDGFWSIENPIIPVFIRNNRIYRALFSALHMNNVRVTSCCEIDFHLKPESEGMSYEQKKEEICARLYAYFRHTEDLKPKQIEVVKKEIADKTHLTIWKNKVKRDDLEKQIAFLKKEGAALAEPTQIAMKACLR